MDNVTVMVTFGNSELKRIEQECSILSYCNYEQKQQFLEGYIHGVISKSLNDLGIPFESEDK